jgi:hypothetical protein
LAKIQANRNIDINKIIAIAELRVEEERKDVTWLISNYQNDEIFSQGESDTLKQYLKSYFKLINDDGILTKDAQIALKNNNSKILVPEQGMYEFILFNDPFKSDIYPIHFLRQIKYSTKDISADGESYSNFSNLENRRFETWDKSNLKFEIKFIKESSVRVPKVIEGSKGRGIIKFTINENEKTLNISVPDLKLEYSEKNVSYLNLETICEKIIPNWDQTLKCQKMSFKDAEKLNIHFSLQNSIEVDGVLPFSYVDDENVYNISINNIQVLPLNNTEAEKWVIYLLENKLNQHYDYISIGKLREFAKEIIENTKIDLGYPDFHEEIDYTKFLEDCKKNNENLFWRIQVAEDLLLEVS